jgi:chromosome partitioning protein
MAQRHALAPRFGLEDVVVHTAVPRLRLAPSCIGLAACEGDTPFGRSALDSHLGAYERPCDFAVIDAPSSLGPITAACVFASTHLLVPVAPDTQGALGLRCLVDFLGNMPCGRGRGELLGVLCNLFDCRSRTSGEFYESLKGEGGDKVMSTIVHRDDLIEACAGRRLPVQTFAPTSVAATIYAELVGEVTLRLGVATPASIPGG